MNREEEIAYNQHILPKIEGHTLLGNVTNRLYALGHIAFGALGFYTSPFLLGLSSAALIVDGLGDLLTGEHHYIIYRALKIHPRQKLEKLLSKEQ